MKWVEFVNGECYVTQIESELLLQSPYLYVYSIYDHLVYLLTFYLFLQRIEFYILNMLLGKLY